MKKHWKWLMSALALVVVLVFAVLLYRSLAGKYRPETPTSPTAAGSAASESSAAAETPDTPDATDTETPEEPSGETAADFVVYDRDNNEVRLSEHFGKPLVVNFWASWCGPCCRELPAFDAAAKQYDEQIGFMMVNLTDGFSETVESVQGFLEENGYTFPVYFDTDEDAASAYSVYSIPLSVFIRADGTVMTSHVGAMDEETLQNYLTQLLA